jgi:hypothetical protein
MFDLHSPDQYMAGSKYGSKSSKYAYWSTAMHSIWTSLVELFGFDQIWSNARWL